MLQRPHRGRFPQASGFTRRALGSTILGMMTALAIGVLPVQAAGTEIAILPKTLINDVFQIKITEAAEAEAAKRGIKTERFAASHNTAIQEQIDIMETLIARGDFGGIVLSPGVARGLGNVIKKAAAAGIYVVLVDSQTDGKDHVTVIATDNVAASEAGADFAAKLIGEKGKVAMLEGEPGNDAAIRRTEGFHKGIAKYPNIELVSSITGHWTLPGGVDATEAMIASNKDIDLIFAASDMMGVGARQVLDRAAKKAEQDGDAEQAKKFKEVKIVGFDGVDEAVKEIWKGNFSATVAQRPTAMGSKAVDILADLMSGKAKKEDFPPYIDSGMIIVTSENADEYAKEIGLQKP